ncbi:MAG: UbiA prenyltransferase family protein [Gemmatimonadetes bacterium]|nr:UbiA prenyltransferase family protein [Gemmatimonadota bacterium]
MEKAPAGTPVVEHVPTGTESGTRWRDAGRVASGARYGRPADERPGRAVHYLRMARPKQWSKNVFLLIGALLAYFYMPFGHGWATLGQLAVAFLATSLVASSNYVINELLDAPFDRKHPVKRHRPAATHAIVPARALALWLVLGAVGVSLAAYVNGAVLTWVVVLWVMGLVYNTPPVRTKDLPYLDVLSESVNNPIRILVGWHVVVPQLIPPVSVLVCFWMLGAFLMSTKRFGEYRRIGDPAVAAAYRPVFRHYDSERLLATMVFYVACAAFFGGIFTVRYKLELVFAAPAVAALLAYYLRLGFKPDSPVQDPERLHSERGMILLSTFTIVTFLFLMFVEIPGLYDLFNVDQAAFRPLWRLGE